MHEIEAQVDGFGERWDFHEQVGIVIHGEMVPVDLEMVRVIRWLNKLPGVKTTNCCEGNHPNCRKKPWITLTCDNPASMEAIDQEFVMKKTMACCSLLTITDHGDNDYEMEFCCLDYVRRWNMKRKLADEKIKREAMTEAGCC